MHLAHRCAPSFDNLRIFPLKTPVLIFLQPGDSFGHSLSVSGIQGVVSGDYDVLGIDIHFLLCALPIDVGDDNPGISDDFGFPLAIDLKAKIVRNSNGFPADPPIA